MEKAFFSRYDEDFAKSPFWPRTKQKCTQKKSFGCITGRKKFMQSK